jgi:hypothetical protein
LWNFVSFAVIIFLLWLVLKDISFKDVYLLLKIADLKYISLAVFATLLTFIVWAVRWSYLFTSLFKGDFMFLLHLLLAGAFFNTITPGAGIGGEPFRAHFLSKRYKKSRAVMLAYVLADKFFQLIVLGVFAVFSILFLFVYVKMSNTLKYVLEGILVFVVIFAGTTIYLTIKKLNFNLGNFSRKFHFFRFLRKRFKTADHLEDFVNKKIRVFARVFRSSVKNKKTMFWAFFLAVLFWMFNFLTTYFLFLAFDFNVNFLSVIIVVTLGNLIGALAMLPGGIAVTEISMTLLFSAMGIILPIALLASFLTRIICYFFSLVIGGFSLLYIRRLVNSKK